MENQKLMDAYRRMTEHYGDLNWWPGESQIETIVGAVLTQNTNWTNVEKAIENLRAAKSLDLQSLLSLKVEDLENLIRPAGYFRIKTQRLRNLLSFIANEYGDTETMFASDAAKLREQLLAVNGVGPETADSILLYAGEKPTFVIDTYTHRVAKRHGWIELDADYATLKAFFEKHLERDVALYNEYHALLVNIGKEHCKPTPRCENCPLQELLTNNGPITWPVPQG